MALGNTASITRNAAGKGTMYPQTKSGPGGAGNTVILGLTPLGGAMGKPTPATARDRRIAKRRSQVTPLESLPDEHQAHIEYLVNDPEPPPKWIPLGPLDGRRPIAWITSRAWHEWHWRRGIDPDGRRTAIPPTLRRMVIDRDGYVCQLCGDDVEPNDVHIDHIKPWSKGGQNVLGNLQVAHSRCNLRKGARE